MHVSFVLLLAACTGLSESARPERDSAARVIGQAKPDPEAEVKKDQVLNYDRKDQWSHMTNWDFGRIGALVFMSLIMTINYGVPVFGKQSNIVSNTRINIADPDTDQDAVWKSMHPNAKIAAIEMGWMWVQIMVIINLGLVAFQPNCNKTICKILVLIFLSWQPVWYLAVLGRVDEDRVEGFRRDWKFIFKMESVMEFSLTILFIWLGWFTPDSYTPSWQDQWSHMTNWDFGRVGALVFMSLIMTINYGVPVFGKQSNIVSNTRINIADPDTDQDAVWKSMHPNAKIAAIEMGWMWVQIMVIINLGLVAFQPNCNKTICKILVLIFVSWQPVWYLAVLGRVDEDRKEGEGFRRDWKFIFKMESVMEFSLMIPFTLLGWFTP